jgi:hypothetical protein
METMREVRDRAAVTVYNGHVGDHRSKEVGEGPTMSLSGELTPAPTGEVRDVRAVLETAESLIGVGDLLGQFRVEARIGRGGLGVVYRAYDVKLKRQVALKVLTQGAAKVDRLLAEARSAAALTHASIAAIYDVQQVGGVAFLVMELVQGHTLRARLDDAEHGRLSLEEAVLVASDIAGAIARAHRSGIVHRDLKPENVVVTVDGGESSAKILDFGLARSLDEEASGIGAGRGGVSGTRHYMAPEQAAGAVADARSDVFSFGVVLHEMLAGQRPFAARGERDPRQWDETAWKRGPRLRALVPQLPVPLERLVESCLELDPAKRPANGDELVAALTSWRRRRTSARRKLTLALAASGAAAVASLVVFASLHARHESALAAMQATASASAHAASSDSAIPATTRPLLEGAGQTWELVDGEWSVEGDELVGKSGHLQTTASMTDGLVELDVRAPTETFGVAGIGFRYSLTNDNPRAQCGYGFNIRHDLLTASFLGEDGDWGPVNGGYRASPAVHAGWNHLVIHMNGPSFTIDMNGQQVDAFTNVLFAEGRLNVWARLSEIRVAHVQIVRTDREVVER